MTIHFTQTNIGWVVSSTGGRLPGVYENYAAAVFAALLPDDVLSRCLEDIRLIGGENRPVMLDALHQFSDQYFAETSDEVEIVDFRL